MRIEVENKACWPQDWGSKDKQRQNGFAILRKMGEYMGFFWSVFFPYFHSRVPIQEKTEKYRKEEYRKNAGKIQEKTEKNNQKIAYFFVLHGPPAIKLTGMTLWELPALG